MSSLMRDKKLAAVRLSSAIERASEEMAEARDEDEKIEAATKLAFLFNDNVEMVIWALKYAGDMPSAKRDRSTTQPSRPLTSDPLPDLPDFLKG
jgi:hypothetical protein